MPKTRKGQQEETVLGYAQSTSAQTGIGQSPTQITGLSTTINVPVGGRKVRLSVFLTGAYTNTANNQMIISIWEGTVGSGTQLVLSKIACPSVTFPSAGFASVVVTPSAGAHTYNASLHEINSGTATIEGASNQPNYILAELI